MNGSPSSCPFEPKGCTKSNFQPDKLECFTDETACPITRPICMATYLVNCSARNYKIRMVPTVVDRLWRVNVRGEVTPSPVGVAMLKLKNPSPPSPNPAMLGPF